MKDLISSVRVEPGPRHDRVHVWNRGGKAGVLVVDAGDGLDVSDRLCDHATLTVDKDAPRDLVEALGEVAKAGVSWNPSYPGQVLEIQPTQTREVVTDDLISIVNTLRQHAFLSSEDEAQRLSYLLWQAEIVKKV